MTPVKAISKPLTIIAPGRVNLLGEHVDYNDGVVLPAAIDLKMTLTVEALDQPIIELKALDFGQQAAFRIDEVSEKVDLGGNPLPHFALYPASAAWAIQCAGLPVPGLRAVYTSNIPIGSGLSSSAAVEVGFAKAFTSLSDWDADPMALVKLMKKGENEYVGVNSGIMDQFACMFGVENSALYLDTRSLAWDTVPLPNDLAIIVADSNIPRQLTDSAYNDRQKACGDAVKAFQQVLPGVTALRDVSIADFKKYAHLLPGDVRLRAQHVVEEIARVEKAVQLLKAGDIQGFGELMVAGHVSLRDLYEVSLPELDDLVQIALEQEGCYGARLTGAGFGGCTVNLVRDDCSEDFITAVGAAYHLRTGRQATLYYTHAARGAHVAAG
jgi:galactokinase